MIDKPTVCGFCSCGCALYLEPRDGVIGALCPSANHPVATGRLCIKGWNATPAIVGTNRLTTPLVRKNGQLQPASWDEAISQTADAIKRISSESGPESIGIIGSAKTTNEECYSLAKLARGTVGTPNVDSACRFYDASLIPGLLATTGLPASQVELNSLPEAGSMLIVGANVMEQLAHIGSRIQDAADNGCKIVAADPRVSRILPQTALFLHPHPGTDLVWIRALLRMIFDREIYRENAADVPGFEELRASLENFDMSQVQESCGVDPTRIAEAAGLLAENAPFVVMFGLGVLQQSRSTQIVKALGDVAVLLGGSVMPLRGQNNAQGSCDMGLMHDFLPGYAPLSDAAARKKWERTWNYKLPSKPGKSAVEMLRGCADGSVKALIVLGENVALSAPNTAATLAALDNVEFLAVADLYLNETAQLADVVFPACSVLEKDGTFTNIERRVQRVRKVIEPLGESWSDLEIIARLASAMGRELETDPERVMVEIAANVPGYETVSYEELDETWAIPLPGEQAARLAPVAENQPLMGRDLKSRPIKDARPIKDTRPVGELRLIAGRINYHQQTGTMAVKSSVLAREYPEAFVEFNESDAEALKIKPWQKVKISSQSGEITRTVALSGAVPAGCIHVPHFFAGDSPNALASYDCDPESGVPVYKGLAVRIEAVE